MSSVTRMEVLLAVGHSPSETENRSVISIDVLFDPDLMSVTANFESSLGEDLGRVPEPAWVSGSSIERSSAMSSSLENAITE